MKNIDEIKSIFYSPSSYATPGCLSDGDIRPAESDLETQHPDNSRRSEIALFRSSACQTASTAESCHEIGDIFSYY